MGLFKSLSNLGKDVIDIATAPVEVAADVTRAATKPVADEVKELVDELKKELGVDDE